MLPARATVDEMGNGSYLVLRASRPPSLLQRVNKGHTLIWRRILRTVFKPKRGNVCGN
jgi:hypothetical protein